MNRRLNLFAAVVILGGSSLLAGPRPAHATYLDPFREVDRPITYCCTTGRTTRCCFSTGCTTVEGVCLKLG